jgi:hypothetical protein
MTAREARARLEAAQADYDRKMAVPVIGFLYSMPAWRRYERAFREWSALEAVYWLEKARDAGPAPAPEEGTRGQ